jgi:hypothetical protein
MRFACSSILNYIENYERANEACTPSVGFGRRDSSPFSSNFLASGISCSQALSTPAHTLLTQTVGRLYTQFKVSVNTFKILNSMSHK